MNFNYIDKLESKVYDYLDKKTNVNTHIGYMLNRTNIMFRYHNLPDSIPATELEKILQVNGYCAIGKINGELYALTGGIGGELDVYKNPTTIIISEPYLNYNATWKINKDCIIIKNDENMIGLLPLYAKYCTLLNEVEITMILSTVNKRVQNYISASDDNTVESARIFLKNIFEGKQGIIADSKLFESVKIDSSNNGNSTRLTDLFEFNQYIKGSLFNEVGLNANYNIKKEHITQKEIEMNNDALYPLVDNMLECRHLAIEKINNMFGTDIQVELNSSWDYRVYNGMSIHNTDDEITLNELEESTVENNSESNVEKDDKTGNITIEESNSESTIESDEESTVESTNESDEESDEESIVESTNDNEVGELDEER